MTAPRACPPPGQVELWLLDPSTPVDAIPLAEAEEARAARMATDDLRRQVRRRRRFLRGILARYLGLAPEAVPLASGAGGKPVLAPDARLHFNISHTGGISVLALGADPLGIDVERRKSFGRLDELMAYTCSPRERAAIAGAPDAEAAFLDRWVIKEAVLKCRGTGLVDNLAAIDPGPVSAMPRPWKELTLRTLGPPSGAEDLHLALAVSGPVFDVVWRGTRA